MNKQASLGELAIELGINKSKLAYYFSIGLLKPITKVGKMNIFDSEKTLKAIKEIEESKRKGLKLKDNKKMK
jgi:DNA-binding transcriptional MerR regulator